MCIETKRRNETFVVCFILINRIKEIQIFVLSSAQKTQVINNNRLIVKPIALFDVYVSVFIHEVINYQLAIIN